MAKRKKIAASLEDMETLTASVVEVSLIKPDIKEEEELEVVVPSKIAIASIKTAIPNTGKVRVKSLVNAKCRYGAIFLTLQANTTYEFGPEIADWLIKSGRCI